MGSLFTISFEALILLSKILFSFTSSKHFEHNTNKWMRKNAVNDDEHEAANWIVKSFKGIFM